MSLTFILFFFTCDHVLKVGLKIEVIVILTFKGKDSGSLFFLVSVSESHWKPVEADSLDTQVYSYTGKHLTDFPGVSTLSHLIVVCSCREVFALLQSFADAAPVLVWCCHPFSFGQM